jgi:hypothetical protein
MKVGVRVGAWVREDLRVKALRLNCMGACVHPQGLALWPTPRAWPTWPCPLRSESREGPLVLAVATRAFHRRDRGSDFAVTSVPA